MGLMKHIKRAVPLVMLVCSAVFCCGAGAQSCTAEDIDHMFDPENLDMSSRPLEGIIEIQEIITLRRGTDKEIMAPTMFGDDICLNKAILLDSADIKEINFKSSDDVSCFEDGRFVPVRKFCSMKSLYQIVPKVKGENKEAIEIEDDKVFFFHIEGEKTPVAAFFYKIQVSNEGNESKKDYPDLEREVLSFSKNGIKKIVFN